MKLCNCSFKNKQNKQKQLHRNVYYDFPRVPCHRVLKFKQKTKLSKEALTL